MDLNLKLIQWAISGIDYHLTWLHQMSDVERMTRRLDDSIAEHLDSMLGVASNWATRVDVNAPATNLYSRMLKLQPNGIATMFHFFYGIDAQRKIYMRLLRGRHFDGWKEIRLLRK